MLRNAKKCPFCKSENLHSVIIDYDYFTESVQCYECGAMGPQKETEEEAIEAWNRRAGEE